ncbi:MAG: tRNA (uridine(34)/cytosine(34)/5-carboxymethylaminomethyluridine(34)-2'-O)-methyltransferase TrmL [Clostridia bacterium]|nr:tRNA (uridine(34)/cytosine(34)/5-carboxymethylaminomethyluridine(34)-2'-O)-methyltransferase TrmL [Clostridia bacterium]
MTHVNIVLFQPEIPQNTGNIARTCAATGASLHLIRPLGFEIDDRKLKRAGLDYWDKLDITYYENAEEFFRLHGDKPIFCFSTKAPRAYTDVTYPEEAWLMFGPETRGLPEEVIRAYGDTAVRIPMRDTLRSLNLSNSVAVAVYEVLRQGDFADLREAGSPTTFSW